MWVRGCVDEGGGGRGVWLRGCVGEGGGQTHPSASGQPAERKTRASEGVWVREEVEGWVRMQVRGVWVRMQVRGVGAAKLAERIPRA